MGGPAAKSFNLDSAALCDRVGDERAAPGNPYAADDAAREPTGRPIRDAGSESARMPEDHARPMLAVGEAGLGPSFYRTAGPGEP